MKTFDLKSLIAGVLIAMVVVTFTLIATTEAPRAWEYTVVYGYRGDDYKNKINAAATNGWEVVSAGSGNQNSPFAVMKRAKTAQRSSWWKFWNKS